MLLLLRGQNVWFKRPFTTSLTNTASHQAALRPWGDAAYLSPYHLPLCIEGAAEMVEVATTHLLVDVQAQHIPLFLQEGPRSLVSTWEHPPVPLRYVLPPLHAGTTRETIHQTLLEITDWLSTREGQAQSEWPALLLCSNLGAQRDTLLDVVKSLNQTTETQLGVIYLQGTKHPPLEKPVFASQLYCHADGKAVLRRNHNHQSVQLEKPRPVVHTPSTVCVPAHKSLA